jgi:hypothetical protein
MVEYDSIQYLRCRRCWDLAHIKINYPSLWKQATETLQSQKAYLTPGPTMPQTPYLQKRLQQRYFGRSQQSLPQGERWPLQSQSGWHRSSCQQW